MSLLDALSIKSTRFSPHLNTGTLLDIASGKMLPGTQSNWVLNGGIGYTTGVTGRPQLFKSTKALSLLMGVLSRYKDVEGIVYDSEYSLNDKSRILAMGEPGFDVDPNRISLNDGRDFDMAGLFELIRKTAKYKIDHIKDYTVETPFIDPTTFKPSKMIIPTIFVVDSLSKLSLQQKDDEMYTKHKLGDSGLNTIYMQAGNAKTQFMQQLPNLAAKAGIYFIMTAHIGDKFELNPFAKSPKDLQYMKGSDTIKGTGSQFNFLTSLLLEARHAKLLQDGKKKCKFPATFSEGTELSELSSIVVRCKNNVSGSILPFVISQHQGILKNVSNYKFLIDHNFYGLDGSVQSQTIKLLPDIKITRHDIRESFNNSYELRRAIELLTQLCYIQNYWSTFGIKDINVKIRIDQFINKILENGDSFVTDLLNSRGYWTYDDSDPRPYMSIFDTLEALNKETKPAKTKK